MGEGAGGSSLTFLPGLGRWWWCGEGYLPCSGEDAGGSLTRIRSDTLVLMQSHHMCHLRCVGWEHGGEGSTAFALKAFPSAGKTGKPQ